MSFEKSLLCGRTGKTVRHAQDAGGALQRFVNGHDGIVHLSSGNADVFQPPEMQFSSSAAKTAAGAVPEPADAETTPPVSSDRARTEAMQVR